MKKHVKSIYICQSIDLFMRKFFIFLLLFFFQRIVVTAQTNNEPMGGGDSEAIDTLDTQDKYKKVIIYSDFTWTYLELERPQFDKDALTEEDWETASIHAYRDVDINSLPETVDLILVDSVNHFVMPIEGKVYSRYGYRRNRPHRGVDIPLHIGDSIHAAFDGIVRIAEGGSRTGGYGNLVIVRHPNGLETYYGHLSKILVKEEETVRAGEVIGLGGSTGRSTGPHLHFETRYMGKAFDPERVVNFDKSELRTEEITLKRAYFNPNSHYGSNNTSYASTSSSGRKYHTIRQGDTLGKIASKYHTSIDKLCKLNKISRNTILRIGRKLIVR